MSEDHGKFHDELDESVFKESEAVIIVAKKTIIEKGFWTALNKARGDRYILGFVVELSSIGSGISACLVFTKCV